MESGQAGHDWVGLTLESGRLMVNKSGGLAEIEVELIGCWSMEMKQGN